MKEFNLVITGVGGQGIITLANIIGEAALKQGLDVKISELHGLAQRGGHIECHVRMGEKIYSSLVRQGKADLIISLEPLEALRTCHYASGQTVFLVNDYPMVPLSIFVNKEKYPSIDEIMKGLRSFSQRITFLDASQKVKEQTGDIIATNIYMLGYAASRRMIPIKKDLLLETIKETVPEKYFEMNKKVFESSFW